MAKKCPLCEAEQTSDTKFCDYCGEPLPEPQNSRKKKRAEE